MADNWSYNSYWSDLFSYATYDGVVGLMSVLSDGVASINANESYIQGDNETITIDSVDYICKTFTYTYSSESTYIKYKYWYENNTNILFKNSIIIDENDDINAESAIDMQVTKYTTTVTDIETSMGTDKPVYSPVD